MLLTPPWNISVVFGSDYGGATRLTRILVLAAILALATNIVGITLGAAGIVRPLLIQNAVAIIVNVCGNLLLVPRYGVVASAWLTVATELFVLVSAAVVIRDRVDLRGPMRAVVRPSLAVGSAALVAILLDAHPVAAVLTSVVTFGAGMVLLRAWPVELLPRRRAPRGPDG